MKIITYNVNGIRSALGKGLADYLQKVNADVVCLQETKAQPDQIDDTLLKVIGYNHIYWHSAVKKGYSGVAILCKQKPENVVIGCGNELYDNEGRVIRVDFKDCSVMSVYMPSGSSGEDRQGFKMSWLEYFYTYISSLKYEVPNLIICGDYNICHRAIDIHDPKGNAKSSGFLPEERDWMEMYFNDGWIDGFRFFNSHPHHYTWWTFRAGAREKNKGWRIDYCVLHESLKSNLKASWIDAQAKHSDHCPTGIELKF